MSVRDELRRLLAREACAIMDGWAQVDAAAVAVLDPGDVSRLRCGRVERFSAERLILLVAGNDHHVELRFREIAQRFRSPRPAQEVSVVRLDSMGREVHWEPPKRRRGRMPPTPSMRGEELDATELR